MSPLIGSPPALKFIIVDFTITCGFNQLVFWCKTDVACHLWLHLTDEEYTMRRIPYRRRGADVEISSVTCFVEKDLIEQDESGDTYEHTFTVPLTDYCVWHYWYLTGTQGGVDMTSISQIFKAHCEEPILPPTQRYEYSTFLTWDACYNFRTNSCSGNQGYGSASDFVAISDHPINMFRSRYKQYIYLYPKCGAEVRLYEADANGRPIGGILTQGTIDKSLIPGYVDLYVPLVNLVGGKHYVWIVFALEQGNPTRVSMYGKGGSRNFACSLWARKYCKTTLNESGSVYPDYGYFENWIINPPP